MGAGFSRQYSSKVDKIGPAASKPPPGLADLPESCVALILSFLDPCDVCGLAVLSQRFRQASLADTVWESKLPPNYKILVKKLFAADDQHQTSGDQSTETSNFTKKEIYARLCLAHRFAGDTMEVWMKKNGGGICVAISWKGLKITGISDRRYWNYISTDESRFKTVAYLQQIWWVEVEGKLELEFPAGTYGLFFRMQLGRTSKRLGRRACNLDGVHGWNVKPVRFQLSTSNGQQATAHHYLKEPAAPGEWTHYHVGDFVVDHTDACTPTKLNFSMTQIDCTHTKGGLCLDSVFVYPRKLGERI
ncbi:F-box protein PP2-A13 [Coffea arabica]|uniref:F-box protein PP2-A13 n=1 Tax=Coffea arabica TaxID=13443 RepID=A0A6P6W5X8_COFAR|nr:F-box protein PP2-A13-like [Coffea arabica]